MLLLFLGEIDYSLMRKEQTWQEQPVNNLKRQVRTSSSANRSFLHFDRPLYTPFAVFSYLRLFNLFSIFIQLRRDALRRNFQIYKQVSTEICHSIHVISRLFKNTTSTSPLISLTVIACPVALSQAPALSVAPQGQSPTAPSQPAAHSVEQTEFEERPS